MSLSLSLLINQPSCDASCLMLHVLSQDLSYLVLSGLVLCCVTLLVVILSCHVVSCRVVSSRFLSSLLPNNLRFLFLPYVTVDLVAAYTPWPFGTPWSSSLPPTCAKRQSAVCWSCTPLLEGGGVNFWTEVTSTSWSKWGCPIQPISARPSDAIAHVVCTSRSWKRQGVSCIRQRRG